MRSSSYGDLPTFSTTTRIRLHRNIIMFSYVHGTLFFFQKKNPNINVYELKCDTDDRAEGKKSICNHLVGLARKETRNLYGCVFKWTVTLLTRGVRIQNDPVKHAYISSIGSRRREHNDIGFGQKEKTEIVTCLTFVFDIELWVFLNT